jgi:Nucleotidyl transferase AbiEii toxin, Type IV TA system
MFASCLDTLPPAQKLLWHELVATPAMFTLYGGTAIALRLGHRTSIDFDFFSGSPFAPAELRERIPYLKGGRVLQEAPNTLTMSVERGGPVQVSFFGGLSLGQVEPHDTVEGPALKVTTLLGLSGMKAAVVTQRAEVKDYLDIHALLTMARISLPTMLSAAVVIYGAAFNPLVSLKAISYHDDDALADLPQTMRRDLIAAVRGVDIDRLTVLNAVRLRRERP